MLRTGHWVACRVLAIGFWFLVFGFFGFGFWISDFGDRVFGVFGIFGVRYFVDVV